MSEEREINVERIQSKIAGVSDRLNALSKRNQEILKDVEGTWSMITEEMIKPLVSPVLKKTLRDVFMPDDALKSTGIGKFLIKSNQELVDGAFDKVMQPKYIVLFGAASKATDEAEKNKISQKILRELQGDLKVPEEVRDMNPFVAPLFGMILAVRRFWDTERAPSWLFYAYDESLKHSAEITKNKEEIRNTADTIGMKLSDFGPKR